MRFFDASVLVKRYVREAESTSVGRLIRAGNVAVSRLSEVEVISAFARSRRLLMQHPLRAGDALQLASALVLQDGIGQPLRAFVAFDWRLLDAARSEQLAVFGG